MKTTNEIVKNALDYTVSNARIKMGQTVRYHGDVYSVDEVSHDGKEAIITDAYGNTMYEVPTKDFVVLKNALEYANDNGCVSCNYTNYTIGRWIHDTRNGKNYIVRSNGLLLPSGSGCELEEVETKKKIKVDDLTLARYFHFSSAEECKKCGVKFTNSMDRSIKNSVVANALDYAAATNATITEDDLVEYEGKVYSVEEMSRDKKFATIEDVHGNTVYEIPVSRLKFRKHIKDVYRNAKFEVGKVYRAPWDRDWLCKVLSRTDSSVKCAIKSVRDKSWGTKDEIVTLRVQPKQTNENGSEVIKGQDWEFWADVTNSETVNNADHTSVCNSVVDKNGKEIRIGAKISQEGISGTGTVVEIKDNTLLPGRKSVVYKTPRGRLLVCDPSEATVRNAAPMSAHEASVLLSGKRKAVTQYSKVEPNTLYYRALGGIFAVPESETMKSAIEAIGSRVLPYQVGGVVGNAISYNDKFSSKFKVGAKGYWMAGGKPYETNGKKVVFTIKEVRDDKNGAQGKKETTYWCSAPEHGSVPIEESKFNPI